MSPTAHPKRLSESCWRNGLVPLLKPIFREASPSKPFGLQWFPTTGHKLRPHPSKQGRRITSPRLPPPGVVLRAPHFRGKLHLPESRSIEPSSAQFGAEAELVPGTGRGLSKSPPLVLLKKLGPKKEFWGSLVGRTSIPIRYNTARRTPRIPSV